MTLEKYLNQILRGFEPDSAQPHIVIREKFMIEKRSLTRDQILKIIKEFYHAYSCKEEFDNLSFDDKDFFVIVTDIGVEFIIDVMVIAKEKFA